MPIAIQKFVTKPVKIEAVAFDGTNGKDVVEWIREHELPYVTAKNGGTYVKVSLVLQTHGDTVTVRKGQLIGIYTDGGVFIGNEEEFAERFNKSKAK